jgi:hypothetical protein
MHRISLAGADMEPTPTWVISHAVRFVQRHYAPVLVDLPIELTATIDGVSPSGWVVTVTIVPQHVIIHVLVQPDGQVILAD